MLRPQRGLFPTNGGLGGQTTAFCHLTIAQIAQFYTHTANMLVFCVEHLHSVNKSNFVLLEIVTLFIGGGSDISTGVFYDI